MPRVNLFARCYIRFYQSKTKIRIQQTYYSKDRILLTFSLTEQHLSKSLQIVVNTNQEQILFTPCSFKQEISIFSNPYALRHFPSVNERVIDAR